MLAEAPIRFWHQGACRKLWNCRDPAVIIAGPAGTGKTRAALEILNLSAERYPGMRGLICRKTLTALRSSALNTFRQHVLQPADGAHFYGGSSQQPPAYHYDNGSELVVAGLDDESKALGTDYDLIFVTQAEELSESELEVLVSRLRNGVMPYQQLIGDCNPAGPGHWILQRAARGQLTLIHSRHEDNPRYYDERAGDWTAEGIRYRAMLSQLTGVRLERLYHGRWVAAEGIVYEAFSPAIHIVDRLPPDDPAHGQPAFRRYLAAVDHGFTNPGVVAVYGLDGDGRAMLVYEVYRTRELDWLQYLREVDRIYHPYVYLCDPSDPAKIATYANAGLPAIPAPNAVALGIETVQKRLRPAADGRPRLTFYRDALHHRDETLAAAKRPACTLDEFESYVWPKGRDGKPLKETPEKENDHGMDCLRYLCLYLDGPDSDQELPLAAAGGRRQTSRWAQ